MDSHESNLLKILPWWLRGNPSTTDPAATGWGTRFGAILGRFLDVLGGDGGAAHEAARARFVSLAPSDALPHAARDTNVPNFLSSDTEGKLRDRIAGAWDFHADVGKEVGLLGMLTDLGFDPAQTYVLDSSTGPYWFHDGGYWSSFAIASRDPSWAIPASTTLREDLYSALWTYKWAHAVPLYVVVVEGDGFVWDLIQAEGYTWTSFEALALTWDEVDDVTAEVIQVGRVWSPLDLETGTDPTWDALEATGVRFDRLITAR